MILCIDTNAFDLTLVESFVPTSGHETIVYMHMFMVGMWSIPIPKRMWQHHLNALQTLL